MADRRRTSGVLAQPERDARQSVQPARRGSGLPARRRTGRNASRRVFLRGRRASSPSRTRRDARGVGGPVAGVDAAKGRPAPPPARADRPHGSGAGCPGKGGHRRQRPALHRACTASARRPPFAESHPARAARIAARIRGPRPDPGGEAGRPAKTACGGREAPGGRPRRGWRRWEGREAGMRALRETAAAPGRRVPGSRGPGRSRTTGAQPARFRCW